jgi:hypothetical protein
VPCRNTLMRTMLTCACPFFSSAAARFGDCLRVAEIVFCPFECAHTHFAGISRASRPCDSPTSRACPLAEADCLGFPEHFAAPHESVHPRCDDDITRPVAAKPHEVCWHPKRSRVQSIPAIPFLTAWTGDPKKLNGGGPIWRSLMPTRWGERRCVIFKRSMYVPAGFEAGREMLAAGTACAAPTARPAARPKKGIASAIVRLWVAGLRSGRGPCRA